MLHKFWTTKNNSYTSRFPRRIHQLSHYSSLRSLLRNYSGRHETHLELRNDTSKAEQKRRREKMKHGASRALQSVRRHMVGYAGPGLF
ncbi:hypothetical protein TSAR_008569 [Trichomalopsis sarcophagae]|uniref:Uncharacterized protein n=1 Tax=Trichomalopsis sarcophagae TaxID=543379 RepID=A0A232FFX3_9HYME|nr:hypothetical protein TSAR_008569 [Trichomalopsis sarcophagae]